MLTIRPVEPGDIHALYLICLQTADVGCDATKLYADPLLLGHHYVGPYLAFQPGLCFVLTEQTDDARTGESGAVVGYVLGTSNSAAFAAFCEQQWFPPIRKRYPLPAVDDSSADASIIRAIHRGHDGQLSEHYPAHLHIDILQHGRRQGFGKKLMHSFFERLTQLRVAGVQLRVGPTNANAVSFYRHLGFKTAATNSNYIEMTLPLYEAKTTND